ncbi:MAG: GNAT family N-acetyltransferase [Deltaproteobacteria bacterium]|nr:GNAT family N-acetyltransferase [Deltaproteobacteria bacterium]
MFGSKRARLKNGTEVILRPMVKEDEDALYSFFQGIPDDQLIVLRHDVKDRSTIQEWSRNLNYERVFPLLAFVGESIVGDATLHRVAHGWKRHIGRVRIVVAPQYQDLGLATLMLNELVVLAHELGLEKLWAEVPLDSVKAIRACRNAGFACKAVIEELVKDSRNQNQDILIMVCDIHTFFDRGWIEPEGPAPVPS